MSMIEVEAPDGTIVEFPSGTPREVMATAMQQRFGARADQMGTSDVPDLSLGQRAANFFQRAGDMVPFADEVRSAGYAAQDIATGGEIDGAWQRARERDQQASQFADENISGVEQVAADTFGLGTSILAPLQAARAAGLTVPVSGSAVGRVGQAAGTGAVAGAVTGLGEGEGHQERSENSLIGAGIGAALGGGIGSAVEGVGAGVRAAARLAPTSGNNARQRALQRVSRRLDFDDLSPEDAQARLAEMRRAGVEPSMMETGPSMRDLGRTVRNQPGEGVRQIDDMVENRAQDIPRAMRSRVDDAMLPGQLRLMRPDDAQSEVREGIRRITGPLYQRVTGQVSGQNRTLRSVLQSPSGQRAVQQASRMAGDLGEVFPQFYDDAGRVRADLGDVDVRALHHIRYALDDIADMGAREGATRSTVGPRSLRRQLDQIMKAASPELARADAQYSFLMSGFDGVNVGRTFDRMSADQLRQWMRQATPPQRFMARLMAAHRFTARIQDMADPTTQLRPGGNRIQSIRALFGSEQAADDFARHVAAQREIALTRNAVTGNSTTARQAANADFEDAAMLADIGADMTTSGGAVMALRQTAARLMRHMPGGMSSAERQALVEILTETDPRRLTMIFDEMGAMQSRSAGRATTQGVLENTAAAASSQEATRALQ